MSNTDVRHWLAATGAAAILIASASPVCAQDSKSPAVVKQLTQLLDQAKLDSIAAPDPANVGSYVAALYFPGSELLVVSAKYAAPPLLNEKIGNKNYRDVYIDLSSASVPGSKLFVIDTSADGLIARPDDDQPFDTVERAGAQYAFNGDWKKAKMSEADYMKAFNEVDGAYVKMLQLLIAQVKQSS